MKVSVAVTHRPGTPGGGHALDAGQSYDGHTLANALKQVEILTASTPGIVLADRGIGA